MKSVSRDTRIAGFLILHIPPVKVAPACLWILVILLIWFLWVGGLLPEKPFLSQRGQPQRLVRFPGPRPLEYRPVGFLPQQQPVKVLGGDAQLPGRPFRPYRDQIRGVEAHHEPAVPIRAISVPECSLGLRPDRAELLADHGARLVAVVADVPE